ncbi:MAG: hypothetical protein Q9208_003307 [Pyrenodesmia sp. 3 TL-2023]
MAAKEAASSFRQVVFKSKHFEFCFYDLDLSANTPQAEEHAAANEAEYYRLWDQSSKLDDLRGMLHSADFKIPIRKSMQDPWIMWQDQLVVLQTKADLWDEEETELMGSVENAWVKQRRRRPGAKRIFPATVKHWYPENHK